MSVPALERHLLTQTHVRLQDKFEECEGEPEEPPPPVKRAPPFHPSTPPSSMAAEVEELVEAGVEGWGALRSGFE